MSDETLIEPFAVQEFYLDGFAGYSLRNGSLFCCGFRFQDPPRGNEEPVKVVQVKLIFPVSHLQTCIDLAKATLQPTILQQLTRAH